MNDFLTIAGVSLVLWAGTFLYFRSYLNRRTSAERVLRELREEVEKLVSEVDLATDRDVTLVEDRIKTLRALLDESDKRIATMKREAERRLSEERAYSELGRRATALRYEAASPRPAPPPPERPAAPADLFAAESAPAPEAVLREAAPVPSAPAAAVPASAEEPAAPRFVRAASPVEPKAAPFFERVAELHRAGFSADLIAKRLGSTIAEVDLAIALSGKMDGRDSDGPGY
jgi:hypothetical protein